MKYSKRRVRVQGTMLLEGTSRSFFVSVLFLCDIESTHSTPPTNYFTALRYTSVLANQPTLHNTVYIKDGKA